MWILPRSLYLATFIGLVCELLVGHSAVSQTASKRMVVLEFKGAKIEADVLDSLMDAVRSGAVEGLGGRGIDVMTRENMMVLLKKMGKKGCAEGDCDVETARNIGADLVVSGSVAWTDPAFVIALKLYETKGGTLLATDQIESKSPSDLLRQLHEHSRNLVANNVGRRPAAPPVPSAQPQSLEPGTAKPSPPHPAPQPVRGCAANQVSIPGGTFSMGDGDLDAGPVHQVSLSAYCIDKTEVTVAAFLACVQAGGCRAPTATVEWRDYTPEDKTKWSQFCTWGKMGLDQHPINCVDWNQATTYCQWTGGRLPTEAEWEYAARGNDSRNYPWGNEEPDATRLNACGAECAWMGRERLDEAWEAMYAGDDGWLVTALVGSYPKGASPFGVLDMAGNVWEWTADTFADYGEKLVTNSQRSKSDAAPRAIRGGGWNDNDPARVRTAMRIGLAPDIRIFDLGFRCARGTKT
ncbi:MAG: formylglycine-generating enzyme family protein [Polyangia bacterium]